MPLEAVHEWAWAQVKTLLSSPGFLERAFNDAERDETTMALLEDLQAARRMRDRYVGGRLTAREVRRLEGLIKELESRLAEARRPAEELGRLRELCGTARYDFDAFTFEERRLALRALGVRVRANGRDPVGWRFEVRVRVF